MKNRISMALKDPILQQGFEIICKENAELKEQCSILADCNTCTSACKTENIEMKKQLTKAKEIIREFVEWANWQGNSNCPSFKSIQDKTEQFISEVEK